VSFDEAAAEMKPANDDEKKERKKIEGNAGAFVKEATSAIPTTGLTRVNNIQRPAVVP
jgi:hypothetical protein